MTSIQSLFTNSWCLAWHTVAFRWALPVPVLSHRSEQPSSACTSTESLHNRVATGPAAARHPNSAKGTAPPPPRSHVAWIYGLIYFSRLCRKHVRLLTVTRRVNIYNANGLRHVVIRTFPLGNVFFRKAIFTRHPDLLQRVLGEFARVWRCFLLHRVFVWSGGSRERNTGLFPVMLLWHWPVFHPCCSWDGDKPVTRWALSFSPLSPPTLPVTCFNLTTRKWPQLSEYRRNIISA